MSLHQSYRASVIGAALLCCGIAAVAQQLNFYSYTKNDGLLNNEVHCITQSSSGEIYVGTPSGLCVYNGSSFENYDITRGFNRDMVSGIWEWRPGRMLAFTNSNQYYTCSHHRLSEMTAGQGVAIKHLYRGYACTFSGLYLFDEQGVKKTPIPEGNAYPGINHVIEWQDSLLIVGRSYEPLDIYNTKNWRRVASSREKIFVRDLCADAEGNIWVATIGSGVLLVSRQSLRGDRLVFEPLPAVFNPFLTAEFRAIAKDRDGNLWMGGINNGIIRYNPSRQTFLHLTMEQGLASNTVFSLFCDRENNCWIGTNRGLQKLNSQYVTTIGARQGLPADLVLDALPFPDGRILTAGYSGVGFMRAIGQPTKKWYPPLKDEYFLEFASIQKRFYGLSLRKLIELCVSPDGVADRAVIPLPEHFRCMIPFEGDKLLLGGDSSLMLLREGKLSVVARESARMISCLTLDKTGTLWAGGLNNVITGYRLRDHGESVIADPVFHIPVGTSSGQDYIRCISADARGRLVYGTSQSGILLGYPDSLVAKKPKSINTSTGLSNNNVNTLFWINDTILLAGTGYGLDKISFSSQSDSFSVRNINNYYDFSSSVYSIRRDSSGNILMGTESGLLIIPSVGIEQQIEKNLPIIISSVHVLGEPDSVTHADNQLELPGGANGVTISYASPSFVNERNTRYTYVLEAKDKAVWSTPAGSNQVTFVNLSPGHYRFVVRPVNLLGQVSAMSASVDIRIRPAFWQTVWFYLALLVAASVVVTLVVRRRIATIQRESGLKNRIAETEMMALRAQMNPHFIFNCMNIIDGLITGNRNEEAQDFLQKFSRLIRLVLENSQHPLVSLQSEVEMMKLYAELETIRYTHFFAYAFDVDPTLIEGNYKIPPLLLQPFVENAIVHGLRHKENTGGLLTVSIRLQQSHILIRIEDNGIGRERSLALNRENAIAHNPAGLRLTHKRIELLNQLHAGNVSIHIENLSNEKEPGTRVIIELPLSFKSQVDSQ